MLDFNIPEYSSWEQMKSSKLPVVVYGMGNGADLVIDELNRLNIEILGVTASDNFVRGQIFRGYKVKKLSEFTGEFFIAVAFGTCIPDVMNHIISLSKIYKLFVPVVPVYGKEIFNREFIEKNTEQINKAYHLFSDASKEIYADIIRFMFSGDLNYLTNVTTDKEEIFNDFLKLTDNESYLDLGAYRGDTVEEFLNHTGNKYCKIIAVEPDLKNSKKMAEKLSYLENFTIINKAISCKTGVVNFSSSAGRNSSVNTKGKEIECTCVDDICKDISISYIKADIEGEETNMLCGAENTINQFKPKLNIALYHRSSDIFEIPILVNKLNPDYKLEIRHHPYIPYWDTNLYAKNET